MLDLSSALSGIPEGRGHAPWPDHEYVKGWGVFGLPFDSGHVLALRVFPESDFGAYRSIWHRDPTGRWSIYVDGPRVENACPRYFGPAASHTAAAQIELTWTGRTSLQVTMAEPHLEWTFTATSTRLLDVLNAVGAAMPLSSWQRPTLVRARERMARALGMGELQVSGVMPSGHTGMLMPQRMYFIDESRAMLEGADLGRPTKVLENPKIGDVPLPARGVLGIGGGVWKILDQAEYNRTRAAAAGA